MATKLTEAAGARRDAYEALRDEAKEALAQTAGDLRAAQGEHADLMEERAALEKDIADIRSAMLTATMPADIEDLAEQLREKRIALRKVHAELLAAQEGISTLGALLASAQEQLKEAPRALTDAENELSEAEKDEARYTSWRDAVSAGTLAELAAEAQDLLDAAEGSPVVEGEDEAVTAIRAAKVRTDDGDADIPAILRTRARERAAAVEASLKDYADLLKYIEDKLYQHAQGSEGAPGASEKLWYELDGAERAFGDVVTKSQARYEEAVSLITSIVNSTALTEAERERIADVALAVDDDALVNEKARDEKAAALRTAEIALDQAIVDFVYDDVDAEPDTAPALDSLRSAVDTAQGELDSAEAALTPELVDRLDAWEVSVPDHIWANLAAYDRAIALLNDIVAADPGALDTAMADAEAALAQALEDEDKATRLRGYLENAAALSGSRVEYGRNSRHERALSAVRGDN